MQAAAMAVFAAHGIDTSNAQVVVTAAQEYMLPQPLAVIKNRAPIRAMAMWCNGQNPLALRPLGPKTRPPRALDDGRVKPKLSYMTNITAIGGTLTVATREVWEARQPLLCTPDAQHGQTIHEQRWIYWLVDSNGGILGTSPSQADNQPPPRGQPPGPHPPTSQTTQIRTKMARIDATWMTSTT